MMRLAIVVVCAALVGCAEAPVKAHGASSTWLRDFNPSLPQMIVRLGLVNAWVQASDEVRTTLRNSHVGAVQLIGQMQAQRLQSLRKGVVGVLPSFAGGVILSPCVLVKHGDSHSPADVQDQILDRARGLRFDIGVVCSDYGKLLAEYLAVN